MLRILVVASVISCIFADYKYQKLDYSIRPLGSLAGGVGPFNVPFNNGVLGLGVLNPRFIGSLGPNNGLLYPQGFNNGLFSYDDRAAAASAVASGHSAASAASVAGTSASASATTAAGPGFNIPPGNIYYQGQVPFYSYNTQNFQGQLFSAPANNFNLIGYNNQVPYYGSNIVGGSSSASATTPGGASVSASTSGQNAAFFPAAGGFQPNTVGFNDFNIFGTNNFNTAGFDALNNGFVLGGPGPFVGNTRRTKVY